MCDSRPLTVELTYEDGKVEQYSYPQTVERSTGIVGGEWVFYELGPKMRHLGEE